MFCFCFVLFCFSAENVPMESQFYFYFCYCIVLVYSFIFTFYSILCAGGYLLFPFHRSNSTYIYRHAIFIGIPIVKWKWAFNLLCLGRLISFDIHHVMSRICFWCYPTRRDNCKICWPQPIGCVALGSTKAMRGICSVKSFLPWEGDLVNY